RLRAARRGVRPGRAEVRRAGRTVAEAQGPRRPLGAAGAAAPVRSRPGQRLMSSEVHMLSDAEESVLVTIDALTFDRVMPTLGRIAEYARPEMSIAAVHLTARRLGQRGFLLGHAQNGLTWYSLSEQGDDAVQALVEREL